MASARDPATLFSIEAVMPLYEYECDACHHRFEVIQKFSDPPIETCPKCGSSVQKLLSSPAIQFKGSGWYITDYARAGKSGDGKSSTSGEGSKTSDTKSESGGDAKTQTTSDTKTDSKAKGETKSESKPSPPSTS